MKTINVTDKDYEVLKELLDELKTQDNDSTANPMWSISSKHNDIITIEDSAEDYMIFSNDGCDNIRLSSLCEELKKNEYDDEYVQYIGDYDYFLDEIKNDFEERDLLNYLHENENDLGITIIPVKSDNKLETNCGLFKSEVKRHIELNSYHYGENPHTYCFSSWRMPKTEELLNILRSIELKE